ncbi:MAG: hypothetical protein AB8B88_02655 [Devosiaceae bacterium]
MTAPVTTSMTRMFLTTVFSMSVLAAFVLIATFDQGAQASISTAPTGADILAAMTTPISGS